MSCKTDIVAQRFADLRIVYTFPNAYSFGGWSYDMQIRDSEGGTLRLTIPAGASNVTFSGDQVILKIKAAELQTLPLGSPISEPWVGVYDIHLIDPEGFRNYFVGGDFIVNEGVTQ